MQRLNRRELGSVLDCLRTTYATLDLEAFPRQVIAALRRVVSAPFGSYNEIDRRATRIRYVVEPAEATVPHLELAVRPAGELVDRPPGHVQRQVISPDGGQSHRRYGFSPI